MTDSMDGCLKVAFGTADGRFLTKGHFGDSSLFLIYEWCEDGSLMFVEDRSNIPYEEKRHGDPGKARVMTGVLQGVDVLVGRRFGPNVQRMLRRFVCVRVRADDVDDALALVSASRSEVLRALLDGPDRELIVLSASSGAGKSSS